MLGARIVTAALAILTLTATSAAAQDVETELRQAGHAAIREGRFQAALSAFQQAAFQSDDPTAWLEVGDAADRLRRNAEALDAYQRYLAARPSAPDQVEIAARVRVLQAVVASGRRRPIGEAYRRGLMTTAPPETNRPSHIGEANRRGIIPAADIIDAIRRGSHAGRTLTQPN